MSLPQVTIIIPAKNAEATIKKCIDSVLRLDCPAFEIIVIDDGSSDNTAKLLSGYSGIKILSTSGIGPSRARNMALRQAQGEFVAFTDADCILDSGWIKSLLDGFSDPRIVSVGGAQKIPQDESSFGKMAHDFLYTAGFVSDYIKSGGQIRQTAHNPTCNVMYRKNVLLELGGFNENLWPGEDVELDYRIRKKGCLLMFNPKAIVYHYRPSSLKGFLKMMFRYGKAQGQLVKKYGFFRFLHFEPVLLLLLIAFAFPQLKIAVGFVLFFILIMALKSLFARRNPFVFLSLFALTVLYWNLGYFSGFCKKKTI